MLQLRSNLTAGSNGVYCAGVLPIRRMQQEPTTAVCGQECWAVCDWRWVAGRHQISTALVDQEGMDRSFARGDEKAMAVRGDAEGTWAATIGEGRHATFRQMTRGTAVVGRDTIWSFASVEHLHHQAKASLPAGRSTQWISPCS